MKNSHPADLFHKIMLNVLSNQQQFPTPTTHTHKKYTQQANKKLSVLAGLVHNILYK